ncbi:TetR family transcriptional regulator [Rhodobacterales bacterium HKCCE2091]|nr:TetR family transcriptional regulator [Rhodobacterales bacterium HKCCE2091]
MSSTDQTARSNPTRSRILAATLKLLGGGAPGAVRMSDIAKAAGISRQALYLHYPSRAELLVAAARHLDEVNGIDTLLAPSRAAATGRDRLDAWVAAWGGYIPKVHGTARALMAMASTDPEAAAAWDDRRAAILHGCRAATDALARDGDLHPDLTAGEAADLLFSLVSIRSWEELCLNAGWPQDRYVEAMQAGAARLLAKPAA